MLFKSQVYTQASGSVGGLTYSHTGSGMYTRGRATPVNPQTGRQSNVRDSLTMYSQMWLQTLSEGQRTGWNQAALSILLTNALGDQFQASGQNHWIRANVPRSQASLQLELSPALATIEDAPTTFELPMLVPPTVAVNDDGEADVTFDAGEEWVDGNENALLVYMGRPRNPSRSFFKGPYRLAGVVRGDDTSAPTSPATITSLPWEVALGQRVKFKFVLSIGDASMQPVGLSAPTYDDVIVGAAPP